MLRLRCWVVGFASLLLACGPSLTRADQAKPAAEAKPWTVGILPVSAIVGVEQLSLRQSLETALDTHFLGLDGVQVVDRAHVTLFLDELVRSKVNRQDLKVGQIVGAEVLVSSQLTAAKNHDVELKLSAIETATGTVLLEKSATLAKGDASSIDGTVQTFAAELLTRRPKSAQRIDVAVLPIAYAGPIDQDATLTDGIRQRLSQALAANPTLRVLHREMGQFVLTESALAAGGLVDPKRKFAPVAGALLVEGTLTQSLAQGKSLDESTLTLKLTVRRQGREDQPMTIESKASFSEAGKLEQEIIGKTTTAVADIAGKGSAVAAPTTSPDAESTNRHWEAQRYIQEAKQIIRQLSSASTAIDAKNQVHAYDLMVRAANLAPDDPRFYAGLWYNVPGRGRFGPYAINDEAKERLHTLRLRFIDGFPSHAMWPTAVMEEFLFLKTNDNRQTAEERKAAVALAERFTDMMLARRVDMTFRFGNSEDSGGYSNTGIVRDAAAALLADGQVELAFRLSIAGADLVDESELEPQGWQILNDFIIRAIQLDHLDEAWRAAQYMQAMYPTYHPLNFDATLNFGTTPIQKLRTAGQLDKWQDFISVKGHFRGQSENSHWLSDQLNAIKAGADPQTVEIDKTPLTGLTAHALPGTKAPAEGWRPDPRIDHGVNSIIAMSPGEHPWCLIRTDFRQKEKFWRVGSPTMLNPVEAPELATWGFGDFRLGYPPAMVEFDDAMYVTTVAKGVYRIDLSTGRATLAATGLPNGQTTALLVHDGSLYTCGGSGADDPKDPGRGFVARLDRGAAAWKVWTTPAKSGQVHGIALAAKPGEKQEAPIFLLYHRGTSRVSEFQPAEAGDNACKDAGSLKAEGELPFGFAASGSTILRFDELNVYRFDRDEQFRFSGAYIVPPATPGTHYWMWDSPNWWKYMKGLMGRKPQTPPKGAVPPWQVAVAVLDRAADVVGDPLVPGRFWIADQYGGLSVMDESRGVAGPFVVAAHCVRLLVGKETVYINTGTGIIEIPRKSLDERLAEPNAWKTPAQVYTTALDRLNEWAMKLPPMTRGVYFCCTHQVERGEQAFAQAGEGLPANTLPQRLEWLNNGGKRQRAVELIEPYVRDVKLITSMELEDHIISTLQQAGEWKRLDEFIPRLWRESPLRGVEIDVSGRTNGYIFARKHLVGAEQYQRELAEILAGRLPETPWKWDENPVYRCYARDIRRWAWLERSKKPSTKPVAK
jgi:hypothetical protein